MHWHCRWLYVTNRNRSASLLKITSSIIRMLRLTKINLERSCETDFGCVFAYACGVHVTLQDYWIFRSTSRVYSHCTFSSRCSRNLRIHRFSVGIICLLLLLFICFCLSVCLLLVVGFLSDQVGLGDRKDIRPLSRRVICGGGGRGQLPPPETQSDGYLQHNIVD